MNDKNRVATVGSKQILVMDDTPTVADLLREMLHTMGHKVDLCQTVEEALAIYMPAKYDLIITDYTMPRMNGMEFAHVIRQRAPEQLILLITGSTFSLQEAPPGGLPINGLLQKPFSVEEFQECVARMLTAITPPVVLPPSPLRSRELGSHTPRTRD